MGSDDQVTTSSPVDLNDRVVMEVRAVFVDGLGVAHDEQESRFWKYGEKTPNVDPQPWMNDPRRTWAHPQDPIVLSFLVRPEHEKTAREWLDSLRQDER